MKFKSLLIFIFLIFSIHLIFAENKKTTNRVRIEEWLQLGPAPVTMLENRVYESKKARADHAYLDVGSVIPEIGADVRWLSNVVLKWERAESVLFKPKTDSIYYFATYPDVYKRLKTTFILEGVSKSFVDVFFDGRRIKKKFNEKDGIVKAELDMLNSKHILLLKVFVPADKEFKLETFLEDRELVDNGDLRFSTKLQRRVNFRNILNMSKVSDVKLSPDGKLAFVTIKKREQDKKLTVWNEVLKVDTGGIIFSTEGSGKFSNVKWLRDSKSLSYAVTKKELTSLFRMDVKTGSRKLIKAGIKNFSNYTWSPDNSYIIYTKYHKKDTGKGFKYVSEIPERSLYPVYRYSIHLFYPLGGVTHKIATHESDFSSPIISPNSKKIILQKRISDNKNRPYFKTIVYIFDIDSLSINKFYESNNASPVMWSPDSKKILMSGGPSAFGGIGKDLEEGVIPNEYDNQLYIFDPETGKAKFLTKNFDPSVNNAFWANKNTIYMAVTEGSYENLYKYTISNKKFKKISLPVDVTGRVWISKNDRTAIFWGSGSANPYKLYKTDLRSLKTSILKDYNEKDFKNVIFGKVENWDHNAGKGKIIYGRIYYPVSFDIGRKYPCIVYYYGGTSPVERSFGGRYPFNWYAANGYIVYIMQPSGAVGYGQKFSAVHVNDWGKTTAGEIIEATNAFLKSHPFVDPKRVGAMGASYGGFLTQYLATGTDIFSAFISHAGISALSSYWGIGDWGYTYSGVASADSFPWNRKDIYVDRSPLFMADKINTPLLLLHGDKDNNVPPGESYQMYAALKILGKEVALITIEGQAHWIMDYSKRVRWMKTIIAWFDKWLKKDSFYWDVLYGKYIKSGNK